jgi:hypothetical protein
LRGAERSLDELRGEERKGEKRRGEKRREEERREEERREEKRRGEKRREEKRREEKRKSRPASRLAGRHGLAAGGLGPLFGHGPASGGDDGGGLRGAPWRPGAGALFGPAKPNAENQKPPRKARAFRGGG